MVQNSTVCNLPAALVRMGGNTTLLRQLVEFSREDLPRYLSNLDSAIAAGNCPEIHIAAHSIKGMVLNFDALAAAAAACRLEQMARACDLTESRMALTSLQDEVATLLETLAGELDKL